MSTPTEEQPSGDMPEFEYGAALESISLLDSSRQAYFDACADYAKRPINKNFSNIEMTMELHSDAFGATLKAVMADATLPEFSQILCHLLYQQDVNRVDFLNAIMGKEVLVKMDDDFGIPDDDDWDMSQEDTYKTTYLQSFREFFDQGITHDTEQFLEQVAFSKPAGALERRAALLGHAIDIGKMALGTAIGIWALRRTQK